MSPSPIINENIENFDLGPYWEEHREALNKLSKSDMLPKSSMYYKEVIADKNNETNNLLLKFGIVNFSSNRKNFLRINAEMTPNFIIQNEEIIFSDTFDQAKRTIVNNDSEIHQGHKEWLRRLYEKHRYH